MFLTRRNRCGNLEEKSVDFVENFGGCLGVVNLLAKLAAIAHAVREQRGELLHLADGVRHFRVDQAAKII